MAVSIISLFSGAGGLDVGAVQAGAEICAAVEHDVDAAKTLRANAAFDGSEVLQRDISTISKQEIVKISKRAKGSSLIVIGGPPCQPFSKNGYWVKNENRSPHTDPRNLVDEFFRVVAISKPDGVLLENVESILHPTNRKAAENITHSLESLGYEPFVYRANALDFGVPQRRKRVFFFGTRRGFRTKEPGTTHSDHAASNLFTSVDLAPHVGVREFLAPFQSDDFFEKEEVAVGGTYYSDLVKVPPGFNYLALINAGVQTSKPFAKGKRFWNFLLKLDPNKPSWTISANPGPWVGPFHWDNRRLRVPELAALQTFPSGYVFEGTRRAKVRQIGNAVPPMLGNAMVSFLMQNI